MLNEKASIQGSQLWHVGSLHSSDETFYIKTMINDLFS